MNNNGSTGFFTTFSNRFWLYSILCLAAVLRLYKLDFKSLWIDELYSVVSTNPANPIDFIINYCKSDQPPFYFLILHFWFKIFAYTSFYARLFSVVVGVISVAATYLLGKEIRGKRTGLIASFLCAVNYFHIYYSQEARFYVLLYLMTIVSFIFFIRSIKKRSALNYGFYLIVTVGLIYTQYFGILVFFIQGFILTVYCLLIDRRKTRLLLDGAFLAVLIAISFVPWMPILIHDSGITSFWIEKPKPWFPAVYYYIYWNKDIFLGLILAFMAALYLKKYLSDIRAGLATNLEVFTGMLLVSWMVLSYTVPYIRSLLSTPVLIPRYTIIALPAMFVVIALGVETISNKKIVGVVLCITLLSVCLNLFVIQGHYTRIDKCQWRESAQAVIDHYTPGTIVYSNQEWWYNYYFYTTEPRIRVLGKFSSDEAAELGPFIAMIENEKELWVLSGETADGLSISQRQYVEKHFKIKDAFNFFAASAVLYEKKD